MSRPSEPLTVLLWGHRWWLPDAAEPQEFADDREAADVLVAHFADTPKPVRLRLIFQPDSLASVAVACPHGDRRVIAQALAGEHPALANADLAWGHEPVLAAGEGFATVLHHETEPRLLALATELARRGLAVGSAWPLATYLQALPQEWSPSGGIAVLAVETDRAVAYCHPANGTRAVRHWTGAQAASDAADWIADQLGADSEAPVLLLSGETPEWLEVLSERFPNRECLPLAATLRRSVPLPRYHPAQLLPREPFVSADRLAWAASVALLLTALGMGGLYARDCLAAQATAGRQATEATALRAEIAHLRRNAAEIAALRRQLAGAAPGAPVGELLRRFTATIPPEVVLGALTFKDRTLSLEGWVAPESAPATATLDRWRAQLAPADAVWSESPPVGPDGRFALKGALRP
jgi:hypothetical protein